MTITALPTPPVPADTPAEFNTKAFALLGALPTFVAETNATGVAATASAATATAQAVIATTQAGTATAQAGTSTAQAVIATTQAGAAAGSAAAALADRNLAQAAAASITAQIEVATHAAASKATPVDADEIPLVDSAAGNTLKKLTWLNLKATLKTYFDTLYSAAANIYAAKGANNDITSLTALTAGGLPDNSVLTADIAAAQITASKLSGAQTGSAPIFGCRGHVSWNGLGTVAIRGSGNVSSITDNGTGDFVINWAVALPTSTYTMVSGGYRDGTYFSAVVRSDTASPSTTTLPVKVFANAGGIYDFGYNDVAVFG